MLNKRPHLVSNETVKTITLPFNGFYNSAIDYDLSEAVEAHASFNLEDESREEEFLDFADSLMPEYHTEFNKKVSEDIADFISDCLNDEFGLEMYFEDVQYHSMTLRNTGDNISVSVKVDSLPSVEGIIEYLGFTEEEFFEQLQKLSDSKLKSCSGFVSFYDHDLTPLKGVPVSKWNSPYVELLIDFLVEDFFGSVGDMETSYLELSGSYGGMLEVFLNCLSEEDLETFNSF